MFVLRVTHCNDATCSTSVSTDVDTIGAVGLIPSTAIGSDGLAIIAHRNGAANALRVTHCTDLICSTGTSTTVDDPTLNVGLGPSIKIGSDNLAVIAHRESDGSAVRVTHCSNTLCTFGTSVTSDDVADAVGEPRDPHRA